MIFRLLAFVVLYANCLAVGQSMSSLPATTPQNPSPMVEFTRAHGRVPKTEVPGKRFTLSVGSLFLPEKARLRPEMPLFVHFHGGSWLAEKSAVAANPKAVVLTVNVGSGSGIYSRTFQDEKRFEQLLDEAARALNAQNPPIFTKVVLSSFSAGTGAIRQILKNRDYWPLIDAVVIVDGLHTSYVPEGKPGPLDPEPLQPFIEFARAASMGHKKMLITHSEIFPGTFASTTETKDFLLSALNLKTRPVLKWGPGGMQQLSELHVRGLHILGFAGNSAPDHVDHFHGLGQWLRLAK